MVHTNTFLMAYKDETAFCSGGGSTLNTPQELVAANLTAIDRMTAHKAAIPKPTREELFSLASGLTPDVIITNEIAPGKGSMSAYFQTSILYDWAVSPTLGTTGTTKAFRYKSPYAAAEKDLYGCQVTSYELVLERGKAIMQNVEYQAARAKTASITPIVGGITAFSTAAPKVFNAATLTVDTKTTANMNYTSFTMRITNTFAEAEEASDISSLYVLNPILKERTYEFEIGYLTNGSDTWDEDELNAAVQTVDATLALSLFTISPVGFNVWETNQDQLESRGIVKRTAKFTQGVGSTYVKS